jgi:hypothetical protein
LKSPWLRKSLKSLTNLSSKSRTTTQVLATRVTPNAGGNGNDEPVIDDEPVIEDEPEVVDEPIIEDETEVEEEPYIADELGNEEDSSPGNSGNSNVGGNGNGKNK